MISVRAIVLPDAVCIMCSYLLVLWFFGIIYVGFGFVFAVKGGIFMAHSNPFIRVMGVYHDPGYESVIQNLTPEPMMVNVKSIKSVVNGGLDADKMHHGVLQTTVGQIDFVEPDPAHHISVSDKIEFKSRHMYDHEGSDWRNMPYVSDPTDRQVMLGEQRVYMEDKSGGSYTSSSINADAIVLMRGNIERPTVYATNANGIVKFASQNGVDNITKQIQQMNDREFWKELEPPDPEIVRERLARVEARLAEREQAHNRPLPECPAGVNINSNYQLEN